MEKYIKTIAGAAIGGILGLTTLFTSIYSVPTDSQAVVRRFGKYVKTTEPGIHLKLPFAVERVDNVPIMSIQKEEFGFRTLKAGVKSDYVDVNTDKSVLERILREAGEEIGSGWNGVERLFRREYLMLTGDLNMADVQWIVQYKVKDPVTYLFNIRNKQKTIRDISEAATKQIVGDRSIDEVITMGRSEIQLEVEKKLQEVLDSYESGIQIVTVKLQSVDPPKRVQPSFNEVNQAKQEREKMVNEAWEGYNKVIPKARGDAEKMIKDAEAYAIEKVNNAEGDANRFMSIYEEYKNAKDVTRRRLYLEAAKEILHNTEQIWIVDQKDGDNELLLKKLDLGSKDEKE